MVIGLLTIYVELPGCDSLKEKRGRLKPVLNRLHREFNISTAEIGLYDKWRETVICCALVSNDRIFTQQALQKVLSFFETTWMDLLILEHHIELIS